MAYSDQLAGKIGTKTKKGTVITKELVDSVRHDESEVFEIRENNAKLIEREINDAILRALEEIGIVAEGYAKRLCPVDTGRLRNSITHAIDNDEKAVVIGTNVEYGPEVEFGRSGTKYRGANGGKGYLRPAAQDHGSQYRSILKKHLTE